MLARLLQQGALEAGRVSACVRLVVKRAACQTQDAADLTHAIDLGQLRDHQSLRRDIRWSQREAFFKTSFSMVSWPMSRSSSATFCSDSWLGVGSLKTTGARSRNCARHSYSRASLMCSLRAMSAALRWPLSISNTRR